MITQAELSVLERRVKSTARNLVLAYGDNAEYIAYVTLTGDIKDQLLEAIRDYRMFRDGFRTIYEGR